MEEDENKKPSLSPLFSKGINLPSNHQSNTIINILNIIENSNFFGSVFHYWYPTKLFSENRQ